MKTVAELERTLISDVNIRWSFRIAIWRIEKRLAGHRSVTHTVQH
jgi:hypothetical protein